MCLYPKLIKNRKYTATKKNGGDIPAVIDTRVLYVPIGCQNCIECRKQKAREWQVRLLEDIKTNKNAKFVTLTFSNESIKELTEQKETKNWPSLKGLEGYNLDNELATRAVRLFLERWRKKYKISIRHWLVTELGHTGTENIHLHGIIWTNEKLEEVEKIWKYGYMWKGKKQLGKQELINYVNDTTIGYITKYVTKQDGIHTQYKSKILTSKGIGWAYIRTHDARKNIFQQSGKTNECYRTRTGHKIAMPIYWRNKIYSEKEKEALWLKRLDKEERWVRGEKVSVKNGDKEYLELLKWHQAINVELGYGDGKKDWKKHEYECEIRNIKRTIRIDKANDPIYIIKQINKENNKDIKSVSPRRRGS